MLGDLKAHTFRQAARRVRQLRFGEGPWPRGVGSRGKAQASAHSKAAQVPKATV